MSGNTRTQTIVTVVVCLLIMAIGALAWHVSIQFEARHAIQQEDKTMFNTFSVTMFIGGQISADHELFFKVPCTCTLRAVSAVASNSNGGTVDVGIDSDPDGFIDGKALGDSDVPALYDLDDFNGAEVSNQGDDYPQITKGDVVEVKVIDGETSPTDTTIVLWFQEG